MIIFFDKKTGAIVGTIEGRVHGKDHLDMWIGDKKETDRLIVQWRPGGEGFAPDHEQQELFTELDEHPNVVQKYKVENKTKRLVKK